MTHEIIPIPPSQCLYVKAIMNRFDGFTPNYIVAKLADTLALAVSCAENNHTEPSCTHTADCPKIRPLTHS